MPDAGPSPRSRSAVLSDVIWFLRLLNEPPCRVVVPRLAVLAPPRFGPTALQILNCPALTSIAPAAEITSLEALIIENCGVLPLLCARPSSTLGHPHGLYHTGVDGHQCSATESADPSFGWRPLFRYLHPVQPGVCLARSTGSLVHSHATATRSHHPRTTCQRLYCGQAARLLVAPWVCRASHR